MFGYVDISTLAAVLRSNLSTRRLISSIFDYIRRDCVRINNLEVWIMGLLFFGTKSNGGEDFKNIERCSDM